VHSFNPECTEEVYNPYICYRGLWTQFWRQKETKDGIMHHCSAVYSCKAALKQSVLNKAL